MWPPGTWVARFVTCAACLALLAWGRDVAGATPTWPDRQLVVLRDELARRDGRPEAMGPLAALLRLEDDLPSGALLPILRKVADSRRGDPLVAAHAAYYLSLEEDRAGDVVAARARRDRLGFISAFSVLGPFDAQGRGGIDRVYPPETAAMDPRGGKRFAGKEREVAWRRAPAEVIREGGLVLDGLLRPDNDAVAYVVSFVTSDRDRLAALRIGSPGPVKVWLNGAEVLSANAVRPPAPDQNAAPVLVRRGENVVVIKTMITSGAWRIYARFTEPSGRALAALRSAAEPAAAVMTTSAAQQSGLKIRELGALLRERAETAAPQVRASAYLDLARYLAAVRPEDGEGQAIEIAAREAQRGNPAAEAQAILGELARDEHERQRAWEELAGAAKDPGLAALALASLGELARAHRQDGPAVASWREALARDPGCLPAILALAGDELVAGLPAFALARLDALPTASRRVASVARARVRALEALGRRSDAEATLREMLDRRKNDVEVLQDLASAARNRHQPAEAVAWLGQVVRLRPDLVFAVIDLARLYEGTLQAAQARALLAGAIERLPDEPQLHEELGRLLAREGDASGALAHLRAALALRPQNPALRRYADRLAAGLGDGLASGGSADDLARDHAENADALAAPALAVAPGPEGKQADSAVVLLDRRVVRVHGNGLSETFAQRVVHVRTDRGARDNQEFFVRYTPGSQEVEIRRAQIFRRSPSGEVEVLDAGGRDDRDLSEPWYGLYYDFRAQVVLFDGLRAGDVLDVEYTLADVASENVMADYFGDFEFIAEASPKRRWDYRLIGPRTRRFFFNEPRLAGLKKTVAPQGDEVMYAFSATDIAKVEAQPSMPGWAEVAPYIHVSTYKTWQDVGRWWWNLAADQLAADADLRRVARETTAGLASDEDKVRALHSFVIASTRYVGLEFGIHGYKPYKVTQVLARRFGDCKDKASLLHALLREVGVESELVLVRTRRGGRIDPVPASLAVFDHAIVYVPRLDLYLDGTAEFSGMTELPSQDQGVSVLRIGPRAATLAQTPVLPSSANRAERSWAARLSADGTAAIDEVVTVKGQAAPEWRQHYQTPGERLERYGKVWSGRFPGARVERVEVDGALDRNRTVTVRAHVQVPRLAEPGAGGVVSLPLSARDVEFVRSYARLSKRTLDLELAYPWQHSEDLVFTLPEGWHVVRAPGPTRIEAGRFGSFSLQVIASPDGRQVRVRSDLDVRQHRVAAADYAAFRAFLQAIDAALGQRIVLHPDES